MLAGNEGFIPTDFQSIQTVTVGSGGSSEINFTNIPTNFQHLQIRVLSRDNRASTNNSVFYRVNADSGSNYAYHILAGDGSAVAAGAVSSSSFTYGMLQPSANEAGSGFAVAIIDILDYRVSKNKTIRTLQGYDINGGGGVRLNSGLWMNTAAITSFRLYPDGGASFIQNSHFALYGIRG